jgi:acyl-CoA synthetase (AMP-forming)/AMP-acid ligase II
VQVAYLQFTSGSTSDPKGVMVTFDNLFHNLYQWLLGYNIIRIDDSGSTYPFKSLVTWLPQYHDLGLLYFLIPAFLGYAANAMAPATFIKNPPLWLQSISKYRATHTGASCTLSRSPVLLPRLKYGQNLGNVTPT